MPPRPLRLPRAVLVVVPTLALCWVSAAGCSTSGGGHPAQPRPVIGEDTPPSLAALAPVVTRPAVARRALFAAHEGPGAPGTIEIAASEGSGEREGAWVVTRRVVHEATPFLTERFVIAGDGSVALMESANALEGVISRFDPPMVVAPAALAPGAPFRQALTLTVHPMRDPSAVQDRGPATQEIAYVGDARVEVAGCAPAQAAHVRSVFRAKLSAASVVNTSDAWRLLPGPRDDGLEGLLAQTDVERATFLGIQVRANRTAFSVLPPPPRAGEPPAAQEPFAPATTKE